MNIRTFLALAGSAVLFFSCNSKDDFIQQPIEGGEDLRGLLTLEGQDSELSLSHEGESFNDIYFTTDEAWSVKDLPDWVEFTDAENPDAQIGHAGTTKLSVRVRPNLSGSTRSAVINIVGSKSSRSLASLTINQPKVIFELSDDVAELPFEWYNYQIKENGEPAVSQPSLKSVTLKTNVNWHQEFRGGLDTLFAYSSEAVSGGSRIDLVPLEPCLADKDINGTVRLIPDFPGITLTSEEIAAINADWIRSLAVSQTHFHFVVDWVGDVPAGGPVFYELGKDLQSQSFSFTVQSDVSWNIAQASDWLELTGAAVGQSIEGSEEPHTVELRALYANPSAEARPFSLLLAPALPEDVVQILPPEQVEGLGKTLAGMQKGLVFKVMATKGGDPVDVCSHEFENEDIGYDPSQKFNVYVKTPCAFADFCEFDSGEDPWFGYTVSPSAETFPADSIYTMTFSLTAQNLDFSTLSTPAAGPNYQKGFAFYSPRARAGATGSPCSLSPKAGLFAQGADVPQVPFVFSQKEFVFDIGWPIGLESILPRSMARQDVPVQSSGRWTCKVTYDSNNENPDLRNWVAGLPGDEDVVKGNTTLQVGSNGRNNYDHSRTARVRFISINHRDAEKESEASHPEFIIGQNEYRFIIREKEEENSAQVEDLGTVPAYQTQDDECGFFLECGGPWAMIACPEYLKPNIDKVDSDEGYKGRITFNIEPNVTSEGKPAGNGYDEIVISADEGLKVKTVKVRQDGFVFSPEQLMTELEAYNATKLGICNMTVTRGAKWHIVDQKGKEVYAVEAASGNKELVEFLPAHNLDEGAFDVPFRLEVQEPKGVEPRQLVLKQKGYQFNFVNNKLSFKELPTAADTKEWSIVCSGPWGIKGDVPAGFHCELTGNDTPNGKIRIWADNNLSVNPVNKRIVFESIPHKEVGINYEWGISLEQESFIWNVTSNSFDYSFAAVPAGGDVIPVKVQCSSKWRARLIRDDGDEPFDNHFQLSETPGSDGFYPGDESGNNYFNLNFRPTENLEPGATKRLRIRIESEYSSDSPSRLYKDIYVAQDPFNWVVTANSAYNWESTDKNSYSFNITSAGDWELWDSKNQPIRSSSTVNGWTFSWSTPVHDNPTRVTVTGSPNYNRNARSLDFTIVSVPHEAVGRGDECRFRVRLNQTAYKFFWNDGADQNNLVRDVTLEPLDDGYREINVECTSDWSIGSTDSWLHAEKSSNGKTLRYKADKNVAISTYSVQHDAPITLTSNGLELKLNVHQKPYEFAVSHTSVNIDPEGTKTVNVDVTCSGSFTVTRSDNWVILDGKQSDMSVTGSKTVGVSAVKDESGSDDGRTAIITFESSDVSGLERTVKLNQTPYILRFSGNTKDSYTFSSNAGQKEDLQLDATVSWNITSPAWITVSPSSQAISSDLLEPDVVPLSITSSEKNPEKTRRVGVLNLYASKDPNRVVASIPVYQDAFLIEGELAAFEAVDPTSREAKVYSSNAWEVDQSASANWIDFSSMSTLSGSGSESGEPIQIYVQPHSGTAPRNGTLVLTNKVYPGVTRTIPITQKAFTWNVAISSGSENFPPLIGAQDKLELAVATSGEYETSVVYNSGADWLEVTDGSGVNSGTVVITPTSDNLETAARTATVTVTHKLFAYITKSFTVTQTGYVFNISCDDKPLADGDVIYYDPAGGTRGVRIESSNGWSLQGLPGWLTTSDALSGDGSAPVIVNMSAGNNGTDALRSGVITITCNKNPAHNISVTLTQDVFRTDVSSLPAFSEQGTDPKSFYVFASGSWTVAGDKDWINTDIGGFTGNNAVNVTLVANPDTTVRTGNVVVSYTPAGLQTVQTKNIAVSQEALVFRASPSSFSFESIGATARTLQIVCSRGGWDITGVPGWLTVTPASGDDGGEVTIQPEDCIAASSRSATLTVTSRANTSIKHEITVTQQNTWIDVSSAVPVAFEAAGGQLTLTITATGAWFLNDFDSVPDWVHLSATSGPGSGEITVTVDASQDTNPRSCDLDFRLTDYNSLSALITINQAAYVAPEP